MSPDDASGAASVVAVVSAFRPEIDLLEHLRGLDGAVDRVIVVDDGSGEESDEVLERIGRAGATVIRLESNSGIATALNAGIAAARDAGAEFVLTLDQDSRMQGEDVAALVAELRAAERRGHRVAFCVPEHFAQVRQVVREHDDGTLETRHSIQSGMLIPLSTVEQVGALRSDLFIDLVDTEFELRCSVAGLIGVAAPGLRLPHSLGAQYERPRWLRVMTVGLGPNIVTLSTPFRYYYRVRNRLVINREFGRVRRSWIMRDTVIEVLHFVVALGLARPRRVLWRLYGNAIRDARSGRMGRARDADLSASSTVRWAALRIPETRR